MRLPEKAPQWKKILNLHEEKSLNLFSLAIPLVKISELNKKYLYWSDLKYRVKNPKQREATWTLMKLMRLDKYEIIPFKQIKLKFSSLSEINKKLHYFDKQLADNIGTQTKTLGLEEKYIISTLMEEAIASSMIEGAATTRKVAKEMLQSRRKPKGKSEKMIFNSYKTMEMISDKKTEKLTPALLLNIQKTVTKETLSPKSDEGSFRDNNEIIVGDGIEGEKIAHIPPDFKEIPKLIKELCDFANTESEEFIHPIVKGIIIHFLIGYIHPFNDGNGRTARSIFYWYMLSQGYWLFEYMAVSRRIMKTRQDYDLAYLYSEYDELDLTYFIKYNIDCIDNSLIDLFKYIKKQQEEQLETRKLIDQKLGLNLRQIDIIKNFTQTPNKLFTIKEICESYNVTYATARADLLFLAEKKLIEKQQAGKAFVFLLKR